MKKRLKPSVKGYREDSPDKNNPMNLIMSGHISMENVHHPVLGVDSLGNVRMMFPGDADHHFPGSHVMEFPMKGEENMFKRGGQKKPKGHTNKNIKSSINELFTRNEQIYGPVGKKLYKPKMQQGGLSDGILKNTIKKHSETLLDFPDKDSKMQGITTDDLLSEHSNMFTKYIQKNVMRHMIGEEQSLLSNKDALNHMRQGGSFEFFPYFQMGGVNPQSMTPQEFYNYNLQNRGVTVDRGMPNNYFPQQQPLQQQPFMMQGNGVSPTSYIPDYMMGQNQLNTPLSMYPRSEGINFEQTIANEALNSGKPYAAGMFNYTYGLNQPAQGNGAGMDWSMPKYEPAYTGNQAYGYKPVMMDENQTKGMPITSQISDSQLQQKKPQTNRWQMSGTDKANMIIAGTNAFSSLLEKGAANKRQQQLNTQMNADNVFGVRNPDLASRGDYETNSGVFRPNQYVPVQFRGYNSGNYGMGFYKMGGDNFHYPNGGQKLTPQQWNEYNMKLGYKPIPGSNAELANKMITTRYTKYYNPNVYDVHYADPNNPLSPAQYTKKTDPNWQWGENNLTEPEISYNPQTFFQEHPEYNTYQTQTYNPYGALVPKSLTGMKSGGQVNVGDEVEMSEEELKQFLAAGGQVEYL